MTGAWHGGKGSLTRKEAKPGSYADNYARIERTREAEKPEALTFKGVPIVWDPIFETGPEADRWWAELNSKSPPEPSFTLNVIGGPNDIRQRLDGRAAMLSGEGLGVLGYGGAETIEEVRKRLFRENVMCALVIGACALLAVAIVAVHALMVTNG